MSVILAFSLLCAASVSALASKDAMVEPIQESSVVEYYAYMDLESADELTKDMILKARNEIIFSESWVADEVDGWVTNPDGTVAEVLPHFSELFPSDWEVPTYSVDNADTVTADLNAPQTTHNWDVLHIWLTLQSRLRILLASHLLQYLLVVSLEHKMSTIIKQLVQWDITLCLVQLTRRIM